VPELPDVERFKQHLDTTSLHNRIARVAVSDSRLLGELSASAFARRVEGKEIARSRRHGKHLLLALQGAEWVVMHFGMNGSLKHLAPGEEDPPDDRLRFDFADGHRLAYLNPRRIGRVGLVSDPAAFVKEERLGPDALDPGFELAAFERALKGRKRDVKSLLMDQEVVAGIGNIYSDEILFAAEIHPKSASDRLDARVRRRLFERMKDVLETAIRYGAGAESLIERLPPSFLLPHRKKGGRCPRCGGELQTLKFSGRTGYFCPRCQKEAP
jgi:formamidopyrimidine-DNA glycosylase